jgi:hypothetical protein
MHLKRVHLKYTRWGEEAIVTRGAIFDNASIIDNAIYANASSF